MSRIIKDITGFRLGRLTVVRFLGTDYRNGLNGRRASFWEVKCDCGATKRVSSESLVETKSCGCLKKGSKKRTMPIPKDNNPIPGEIVAIDLSGRRFGRLTVVRFYGFSHRSKKRPVRAAVWVCKCDCGREINTRGDSLLSSHSRSCGCLQKEIMASTGKKRFMGNGVAAKRALYRSYRNTAKSRGYDFSLTNEDMDEMFFSNCHYCGSPPSQFSGRIGDVVYNGIDRVDNKTGYVKENCVPCCGACNKAKGTKTVEEFFSWADRLSAYRQETAKKKFYFAA